MNALLLTNEGTRNVVAGKLPCLEDLLWEWVTIQERSIRIWKGEDALWWYGERTALGAFAGSIWRSGGFVLEEYSTQKLSPEGRARSKKESCAGRGDMDFELGGQHFSIEAKSCWARMSVEGRFLQSVQDALEAAKRDAYRSQLPPGYSRLAVVFCAPSCVPRYGDSIQDLISACVRAARNVKGCACAWAFPELGRKLRDEEEDRLYPGATVFVKWVGGRRPRA
jgi:hypothetical protein